MTDVSAVKSKGALAAMKKSSVPTRSVVTTDNLTVPNSLTEILMNPRACAHLKEVASLLVNSTFIPVHYRSVSDVMFLITISRTLGVDLPMVAQKTYPKNGSVELEGQLVIAALNAAQATAGNVDFEYKGKGQKLECIASITRAYDGELRTGSYSLAQAKATEFPTEAGVITQYDAIQMYKSEPEVKLSYDAAARLARLHFPQVFMGLYMKDEIPSSKLSETLKGRAQSDFKIDKKVPAQAEASQE